MMAEIRKLYFLGHAGGSKDREGKGVHRSTFVQPQRLLRLVERDVSSWVGPCKRPRSGFWARGNEFRKRQLQV